MFGARVGNAAGARLEDVKYTWRPLSGAKATECGHGYLHVRGDYERNRGTDESPITHTLREWLKSMGYGNYGIWERLYAQICKTGSPKSYGLWEIMGYRSYGLSEIHL